MQHRAENEGNSPVQQKWKQIVHILEMNTLWRRCRISKLVHIPNDVISVKVEMQEDHRKKWKNNSVVRTSGPQGRPWDGPGNCADAAKCMTGRTCRKAVEEAITDRQLVQKDSQDRNFSCLLPKVGNHHDYQFTAVIC